jgi:hypothetical protein
MSADEDYVPHSARLAFKLTISKGAEADEEYTSLFDETQDFLDKTRPELKKKIISTTRAKIETRVLIEAVLGL